MSAILMKVDPEMHKIAKNLYSNIGMSAPKFTKEIAKRSDIIQKMIFDKRFNNEVNKLYEQIQKN